jgi:paraquat-inducible protein B
MAKQANRKIIGGFVLIAVGILAASIVIFGSGDWFKDSLKYVLRFQESVKGLNVGSPVLYRGFPVGEVQRVIIQAGTKDLKDDVLVFVEIYPETVVFSTGDINIEQWKKRMSDLIDRGLRAQMVPQSLITGKLIIELNMHAEAPAIQEHVDPNYVEILSKYEEIPTIPSTLSKLEAALGNLDLKELSQKLVSVLVSADRILQNPDIEASISEFKGALGDARGLMQNVNSKVDPLADNLNGTLTDARGLVNNVAEAVKPISVKAKSTMDDIGKLARHVDGQVDPISKSVTETLKSVDSAFKSIDELVGKRSPTRADLENTLKELAAAARSLRVLADYLEQHPDALIKGKSFKKY